MSARIFARRDHLMPDSPSRPERLVRPMIAVLIFLFLSTWPARAVDRELLARVLIPAFMAQNFAALCVIDNPTFVEETAGSQGHVHIYAKHVKDEISNGLSLSDVETVLRMAADTAQSVVKKEISEIQSASPSGRLEPLASWCEKTAKPFVREIIEEHFERHTALERIIVDAKRD